MSVEVFSITEPEGAALPLVFDSPHSGDFYPGSFVPIVGPAFYRRAEDMDVDVLFDCAPSLGAWLLKAHFGRIFVDVNRARNDIDAADIDGIPAFAPEPSAKARLAKGVIWMAAPPDGRPLYGAPLPAEDVETRLAGYWDPYRQALAALLARTHAAHGRVFYIDCHSMQAVSNAMHEEGTGIARADMVLGDRKGESCDPAFTRAAAQALEAQGFSVAINEPYQGADLVRTHGRPAEGFHALQIEVNRGLYMNEETLTRTDRFEETHARIAAAMRMLAGSLPG